MPPMPITIAWDSANNTLTASPNPLYVASSAPSRQITWMDGTDIDTLQDVVITKKDSATYEGSQPAVTGASGNWQWRDPEGAATYEFLVTAAVHDVGVKTLDPRIINT